MSASLQEIIKQLENDERNSAYTERGIPPIFQINADAKILLIGQAPGKKVEESKIPFHDQSGKTLMDWLGMTPDVFYSKNVGIMPMDFYYPGKGKTGDLPPRKFIAQEYHSIVRELMPDISLTVLIGRYAVDYYLKDQKKRNLTETVRTYEDYIPEFFPIVHPSPLNIRWQKKNPWFMQDVVPALQHEVRRALK